MVDDIKGCANACDTYAKQRRLSKVLFSVKWDRIMQEYVEQFNKHRANIELALATHMGKNIDVVRMQVGTLHQKCVSSSTSTHRSHRSHCSVESTQS